MCSVKNVWLDCRSALKTTKHMYVQSGAHYRSADALRSLSLIPLVSWAFSPMRGWGVAKCPTNVGVVPSQNGYGS